MNAERDVRGRDVAVLGLGRSGRAAARLALARGARSVYASDAAAGAELEAAAAELRRLGARAEVGRHDARLAHADLVVVSPGIPPTAPIFAALRSARVIAEVELASWYLDARIAGVTGTNGKTTTTALLQAMCERGGLRSVAAGNIGVALSEVALDARSLDWVACELSSFQLARIESLRPHVGVLTNVAPDHLDRYPDLASYVADKEMLTRNMTVDDPLVLNADDPGSRGFAAGAAAQRHYFSSSTGRAPGVAVRDREIVRLGEDGSISRVAGVADVRLRGPHNLQNALAATLAALLIGVTPDAVAAALREFPGVPHRLEEVGRVRGVLFVNDSKATNVDATRWALRSFEVPIQLILGGRHKGSPYASLLPEMGGNVKNVFALGEARELIAADLGGHVPVRRVETLGEAVEAAFRAAHPDEVVLLSPACSSYDMFRDYEDRGRTFREAVEALASADRARGLGSSAGGAAKGGGTERTPRRGRSAGMARDHRHPMP